MAAKDPARRNQNVRLAALARWTRERARLLLALLWLVTFVLPPVAALALPAVAQTIVTYLFATVPLSLAITWRLHDSRKHN